MNQLENVEDVYQLSPIQEGMLFHAISEPNSGAYVEQHAFTVTGKFDQNAFRDAWHDVIQRHSILRTAFLWDGLDEPLQVVRRNVSMEMELLDWQNHSPNEFDTAVHSFLVKDRGRGFDLSEAPLLRLAIIDRNATTKRIIWSFHHIISDGFSIVRVLRDVWNIYSSRVAGVHVETNEPVPYREYVAWMHNQDLCEAESFWRNNLKGFRLPSVIPTARTNTRANSNQFASRIHKTLTRQTSGELRAFARKERVTLNTLIQAAWAFVLNRYCGEHDIVFGVTVSGRSGQVPDSDEIVGPLLNTLPLRVSFHAQTTISDWLASIQAANLAMREHEHTPLAKIQRWSEIAAGQSLFESLIAFENIELPKFAVENLEISDPAYFEESNYPLALLVFPDEEIRICFVHKPDRFPVDLTSQISNHVIAFLERLPNCGDIELGTIPFFTETEISAEADRQAKGLVEIPDVCIHDLIAEQVQINPNATAVIFSDQSLTYQELSDRADDLAGRLSSITAGEPIGLFVERSAEMIVGILGILKAGGAYVPLDPSYPTDRIEFLVEDSSMQFLLTTTALRDQVSSNRVDVVCIDEEEAASQQPLAFEPPSPSTNAYVMYTSGSTGKPKGVEVTHSNLVQSTAARIIHYPDLPDVFLLFPSFSFDSSVAVIFWTLCTGGTIVIPSETDQHSMHRLADLIEKWSITHLLCLPSICDLLFDAASSESLTSLQTIIVAGESCSADFIRKHSSQFSTRAIYNEYGPTECTVWATVQRIDPTTDSDYVPIGTPIANTRVLTLDKNGNQTPFGIPGELCIAGLGVSPGYWRRPELTKERFVPALDSPDQRMYRTGDLASIHADGSVDFLGRIDDQLKIRGIRIEPGEIEAIIIENARIREAVVIAYSPLTSSISPNDDDVLLSNYLRQLTLERAEVLLSEIENLSEDEAKKIIETSE